jgi:hypothetical protein
MSSNSCISAKRGKVTGEIGMPGAKASLEKDADRWTTAEGTSVDDKPSVIACN